MTDDYDEGFDKDDDEADDDLQIRKGNFLQVERVGSGYRETSVKGALTEYQPSELELEINIDDISLHAASNVKSGTVRPFLKGKTCESFRAIGTEGSYPIFDVSIGSDVAIGTAIIRNTYGKGGHALRGQMSIGLADETVKGLIEKLPGTLRIGGIEKRKFYSSEAPGGTRILDHWSSHVVPKGDLDEVKAEWHFKFATVTLSPEGYSEYWPGYRTPPEKRYVSGDIGIHFSQGHPLKQTIEDLAESLSQVTKNLNFALAVIAAALVYLAFKVS